MRLRFGRSSRVMINLSSDDLVALFSLAALGAIVTSLVIG